MSEANKLILKSASEVIDALGGNRRVMLMLNVGSSAVSNYRKHGFSERACYRIAKECEARGISVAPHVFDRTLSAEDETVIREEGKNFRAVRA